MCQWVNLQWVPDVPLCTFGHTERKIVITSFKEFFPDLAGPASAWVIILPFMQSPSPQILLFLRVMLRTSLPPWFPVILVEAMLTVITCEYPQLKGLWQQKLFCYHSHGNPAWVILLGQSPSIQWSKNPGTFRLAALPSSTHGSQSCHLQYKALKVALKVFSICSQVERKKKMEDGIVGFQQSKSGSIAHHHLHPCSFGLNSVNVAKTNCKRSWELWCECPERRENGFIGQITIANIVLIFIWTKKS